MEKTVVSSGECLGVSGKVPSIRGVLDPVASLQWRDITSVTFLAEVCMLPCNVLRSRERRDAAATAVLC